MDPSNATLATLATAHKRHISDATIHHSCQEGVLCALSIIKVSKVSDGLVTFQHPASALASHPWHPEIIAVHVTEVAKSGTLMAVKEGKLSGLVGLKKASLHSPTLDYNKLNCLRIKL